MPTTGYYARQYVIDYLANAGGVNSTTTTITVQDGSKLAPYSGKPGVGLLSYTSPLVESDIEWFTFTSYNTTTKTFVGVTRGQEGSTAKSHANGVKIAFPVSRSHINTLVTALEIDGSATNLVEGVLDEETLASDSATKLPTQHSVKAYVGKQTSVASSATLTPTGDRKTNELYVTALAVNATFAAPTGTPVNGNRLLIRVKDNGTAQTLSYNAIYSGLYDTLPATTTANKHLYMLFVYNSATSKWEMLATQKET